MTSTLTPRPEAAMRPPLIAAAGLSALAGWTAHATYLRRALRAARCDPVTGLPGRAGWTAQAARIMRGRGTRTVILVDVDRFKRVNDTYGHAAGDELLAVTAARLCAWAARVGGGACGRLGGDEFTAITRRAVTDAETADLAALLATAGTVARPRPRRHRPRDRVRRGGHLRGARAVGRSRRGGRCHVPGQARRNRLPHRRASRPGSAVGSGSLCPHPPPWSLGICFQARQPAPPGSAHGARPARLRRVPGAASPGAVRVLSRRSASGRAWRFRAAQYPGGLITHSVIALPGPGLW